MTKQRVVCIELHFNFTGGCVRSLCVFLHVTAVCLTPRVNCEMNLWSEWSSCTKEFVGPRRHRQRSVHRYNSCGGTVCPHLRETEVCSPGFREYQLGFVWGGGCEFFAARTSCLSCAGKETNWVHFLCVLDHVAFDTQTENTRSSFCRALVPKSISAVCSRNES